MNRTPLLLALALALPAGAALAQGPGDPNAVSWSYFDIGALHVNPDESDLDSSTGLQVRGSGQISENWHLFLGWNRVPLEGDRSFTGVGAVPGALVVDDDVDRFNVGIGYNLPVGPRTDLFVRAAYERIGSADFAITVGDATTRGKLEKTDGASIEVGVRSAFTPRFEAGASVRYTRLDDAEVRLDGLPFPGGQAFIASDGTTAGVLYGQFKFGNGWGLLAEAELSGDYTAVFAGARLSY